MSPSVPHVVIIGNQAETMVRFRGGLLARLVSEGARVTAICPTGTEAEQKALEALGVRQVPLRNMSRSTLSPLQDFRLILELRDIMRELSPTHALSYFLKPAIYGSIAAGLARVPRRIAMIEGLGFAFSDGSCDRGRLRVRRLAARTIVTQLLRQSLRDLDAVVVLNSDDAAVLERQCGIPAAIIRQIDGIGVDIEEFAQAPFEEGPTTFCLAARLIREKGVFQYIEAARRIKATAPETQFILLGDVDHSPNSISRAEVESWVDAGLVSWPGKVADVRPWYAKATAFVLPSFYGEGLPRSIMEAMAVGRPVITTTAPGCGESVTDGISGFVVPPKDVTSLVDALMRFVAEPTLARTMGEAAAREARRRYEGRERDAMIAQLLLPSSSRPGRIA